MPTSASILENAKSWLSDYFDPEVKREIQHLIENDPDELSDRFYKTLEFGTGGMRGIMGTGTNRINKYTLGKSTQGLSSYLKKIYGTEGLKVVIAYDCRHNSKTLGRTVAEACDALKEGATAAFMAPRAQLEACIGETTERFVIALVPTPPMALFSWTVGMAVKADHRDLAAALEKALNAIRGDGSLAAIFERHHI